MATIAARLKDTGTLYTTTGGVGFDERSQNQISITPTGVYAALLDEVTGTDSGKAMQQLKTGTLRIAGVFDEVSGI